MIGTPAKSTANFDFYPPEEMDTSVKQWDVGKHYVFTNDEGGVDEDLLRWKGYSYDMLTLGKEPFKCSRPEEWYAISQRQVTMTRFNQTAVRGHPSMVTPKERKLLQVSLLEDWHVLGPYPRAPMDSRNYILRPMLNNEKWHSQHCNCQGIHFLPAKILSSPIFCGMMNFSSMKDACEYFVGLDLCFLNFWHLFLSGRITINNIPFHVFRQDEMETVRGQQEDAYFKLQSARNAMSDAV